MTGTAGNRDPLPVPLCTSFIAQVASAARVADLILDAHECVCVVGPAQLRGRAALAGEHEHRTVVTPAGEAALERRALGGDVPAVAASGLQGAVMTHQDPAAANTHTYTHHHTQESLEEAGPGRDTHKTCSRWFLLVHYNNS